MSSAVILPRLRLLLVSSSSPPSSSPRLLPPCLLSDSSTSGLDSSWGGVSDAWLILNTSLTEAHSPALRPLFTSLTFTTLVAPPRGGPASPWRSGLSGELVKLSEDGSRYSRRVALTCWYVGRISLSYITGESEAKEKIQLKCKRGFYSACEAAV